MVKTAVYSEIRERNKPSFFATPVAWAAANFAQLLIDEEGGIAPNQTGLIAVSDECSLSTLRDLSLTMAQGAISPLRFCGASPSIVAGLPALQQGIRGPTLCLTMQPAFATNAIFALIKYWLRYSNILSVIAIAHHMQAARRHQFKGLIATSAGDELEQLVLELTDPRTAE